MTVYRVHIEREVDQYLLLGGKETLNVHMTSKSTVVVELFLLFVNWGWGLIRIHFYQNHSMIRLLHLGIRFTHNKYLVLVDK